MLSNKEIGARMESRRLQLGLTMDDVAMKIGVAKSTVQRYEKGQIQRLKLPIIEAMAKALGVTADWLIGNEEIINLGTDFVMYDENGECIRVDAGTRPGHLLMAFDELNEEAQEKAIERVKELTEIRKYQKHPPQSKPKSK